MQTGNERDGCCCGLTGRLEAQSNGLERLRPAKRQRPTAWKQTRHYICPFIGFGLSAYDPKIQRFSQEKRPAKSVYNPNKITVKMAGNEKRDETND